MSAFGFVIVRYVKDIESSLYWQHCCKAIRKLYPQAPILIVDDNSDKRYLTEFETTDYTVVNSEFPRRGELLGYYYFHKLRPFEKAVVIHDNVFFNRTIDFNVHDVQFLWTFDHTYDNKTEEELLLAALPVGVRSLYSDGTAWLGCYGVMSVISWTFLDRLDAELAFFSALLPVVTTRDRRKALERVFACACTYMQRNVNSTFGDIHQYRWGRNISFEEHLRGTNADMPVVKILTGR
jgi:hypothetical protein